MIERAVVRWLLGLTLLIITTYPGSPFFYQFLVGNAAYAYLACLILFLVLSVAFKNSKIAFPRSISVTPFLVLQLLAGMSLSLTLITTRSTTAVRDLATFVAIWIFLFLVRNRALREVLTSQYLLVASLVCFSITAYLLYFAFPEMRIDWLVTELSIDHENPIIKRQDYGDFEYSLLFYHSTLLYDQNSGNILAGSFFAEPTWVFVFCLGPLFYCIFNESFKGRYFAVTVLATYMLFTFTVFAVLVIVVAVILALAGFYLKPSVHAVAVSSFLCVLLIFSQGGSLFLNIVELLPESKGSQLDYYFGPEQVAALASGSSIFGLADVPEGPSWGAAILIFRYGYFGFFIYLSLIVFYILESFRLLVTANTTPSRRIFAFMALFCSTMMSLKTPNFLLITSLVIYISCRSQVTQGSRG